MRVEDVQILHLFFLSILNIYMVGCLWRFLEFKVQHISSSSPKTNGPLCHMYSICLVHFCLRSVFSMCVFSEHSLFPRNTRNRATVRCPTIMVWFSFGTCLGSQVCPVPRLCSVQHILHLQLLTHVRDWLMTLVSLTTFHSFSRFCRVGLWNWMKELCSMGKSLPVLFP